jgi:protein O-GlcNAc transferase
MNFIEIEKIIVNSNNENEIENCINLLYKIEINEEREKIINLLAFSNLKVKKYDKAIYYYMNSNLNGEQDEIKNYNLSLCYIGLKKYDEAMYYLNKNINNKKYKIENIFQRAYCYLETDNFIDAKKDFDYIIAGSNSFDLICKSYFNIGNISFQLKNYFNSIRNYKLSLSYNKDIKTLCNLGVTYLRIRDFKKAENYLLSALEIDSKFIDIYLNLGILYLEIYDLEKSNYNLEKALSIDEKNRLALYNMGVLKLKQRKFSIAVSYFEKLIYLNDDIKKSSIGHLITCYLFLADWSKFNSIKSLVLDNINELIIEPLTLSVFVNSNKILHRNNINYNKKNINLNMLTPNTKFKVSAHKRIRLGFYSADFRIHPISVWLLEQIENHDKSKFELFAFSFQSNYNDPVRKRFETAFDHFIVVDNMSNFDLITLSRQHEIDIAIDLSGYTQDNRAEIFAYRVAPIQISHLGFPGTSGSQYIDYLISDNYQIPEEEKNYFTEKILYVSCLYTYDRKRIISATNYNRSDFGLPLDSIVFTCQNSVYKILPEIFEIWMNLLLRVEKSILWLQEPDSDAIVNIRNQAVLKGVDFRRLVFLKKDNINPDREYERVSKYLSSYKLADIFLDTSPYNGGTTVVDALWAGIPVVTLSGNTVVSRMATSALHSIGLTELITTNLIDYENLAFNLATDKIKLSDIKDKIQKNKKVFPIFDTNRNLIEIEKKYIELFKEYNS